MDFEEFQREAAKTAQLSGEKGLDVAFLGLGGEAGSLLTEYKKRQRDGEAHERFPAMVAEELGDVLWYVAAIASGLGLDLEEIAMMNVAKTHERWGAGEPIDPVLPDESYPASEQLPRKFSVRIEEQVEGGRRRVRMWLDGELLGDPLTNNAYDDDGYRYHDVFHLAYAAVLGWSPVLRKLLKRKRRSNHVTDEVEDGGRAQVIEEGVAAFVYEYAKRHAYLDGIHALDYTMLRTVKGLTGGLEVGRCTLREWEDAILQGFSVWRALMQQRNGVVVCDLRERKIELSKG